MARTRATEWILNMRETASDKLARLASLGDRVQGKMMQVQDKLDQVGGGLEQNLNIDGITSRFGGNASRITGFLKAPMAGIAAIGVAAIAVGAKGASMAMDFEQGMAKINATAQLAPPELAKIRNEIIEIGQASTSDLMLMPAAYEKINSQINDTGKSMEILRASSKAAQAGFSNIDVVAGAAAQTMSSLGKNAYTATEILDTYAAAKRLGAGEFTDFANYIPQLVASGRNLGVQFKDTAASFAFMTARGQDASTSAMLIQNMYTALGKQDIQKGLGKIGVNIFDKNGMMRNLDEIFGELSRKMEGLSDQQKSNLLENMGIRDAQAKQAFSVMLGDVKGMKDMFGQIRNSAGEVERAMAATKNPLDEWKILQNEISGELLKIGYAILPYIMKFITAIRSVFVGVRDYVVDLYKRSYLLQDLWGAIKLIIQGVGLAFKATGAAIKFLWDHSIKPVIDLIVWGYNKMMELAGRKPIKIEGPKMPAPSTAEQKTDKAAALGAIGVKPDSAAVAMAGNGTSTAANSISGGGTQTRNVIVNIGSLVDKLAINANGVKEGAQDMQEMVMEYLLRAVNGAEQTTANA